MEHIYYLAHVSVS